MKARTSQEVPPPCSQGTLYLSFRGRTNPPGVTQGQLRLRSLPGAFLVLGLVVVFAGSSLAMAGYWNLSEPQSSGWSLASKDPPPPAGLIPSGRMKALGAVIVGVGLFLLICASTALYENRDRETKRLSSTLSAPGASADIEEPRGAGVVVQHHPWIQTSKAAPLNVACLPRPATSQPPSNPGKKRSAGLPASYHPPPGGASSPPPQLYTSSQAEISLKWA